MGTNKKQDCNSVQAKKRKFLDFLSDWQNQHKEEYISNIKGFEHIKDGDYSDYLKWFEYVKYCIPPYFFTLIEKYFFNRNGLFFTLLRKIKKLFGKGQKDNEISKKENELIDKRIDELYDFDGFIKLSTVDSVPDVDLVKEKEEQDNPDIYYYQVKGVDEWWQSIPSKYQMIASSMFPHISNKKLKIYARRIFLAGVVYLPNIFDNLCKMAYEKKDPLLLSGLYYIMLDHGLRTLAKQFSSVLSTSTSQLNSSYMPSLVTNGISMLVQTSISKGYDKKADWKADFKNQENADLRSEVLATIKETKGKHGRPLIQRETFEIDNYLIGDKIALKKEIKKMLEEMKSDYYLAYLKKALIESEHLDKSIKFPIFFHAICQFADKDYEYDRAQRLDTMIEFNKEEFEKSEKPKIKTGREVIERWTKRLEAIPKK